MMIMKISSCRIEKMGLELLCNAIVINWQPGKINLQQVLLNERDQYQEETKSGFIYLY